MAERRICSFCGGTLEPGTGKMYVRKDGTIYYFCSGKCQKNLLKLRRTPRKVKWTKLHHAIAAEEKARARRRAKKAGKGRNLAKRGKK